MIAPGTMAPEASVTRPFSVAMDCACAEETRALSAAETTSGFQREGADALCAVESMMPPLRTHRPDPGIMPVASAILHDSRCGRNRLFGLYAPWPIDAATRPWADHGTS